MIKWAQPQYLYLLGVIPIVVIALVVYFLRRWQGFKKIVDPELIPRLNDTLNHRIQVIKSILFVLGLLFLVISLARPKWGERLRVYKGKGIDIVIALDASKSMLAQDVKPTRLARAKTEILSLLEQVSTNRVGITAFAGDTYVMCPLTTDIEAAKLFLDIISPDVIPKPGTNLERAITVSASLFNPREKTYKALILITDGDNLQGRPLSLINFLKEQGIRLFTIGVGTIEGSPVPEFDKHGNLVTYKKDKENKIVMTRLTEKLLIVLARSTGGRYFRARGNYLSRLVAELNRIKKKEIGGGEYVEYEERYQYFLLAAFISIFLGLLLNDRRGRLI